MVSNLELHPIVGLCCIQTPQGLQSQTPIFGSDALNAQCSRSLRRRGKQGRAGCGRGKGALSKDLRTSTSRQRSSSVSFSRVPVACALVARLDPPLASVCLLGCFPLTSSSRACQEAHRPDLSEITITNPVQPSPGSQGPQSPKREKNASTQAARLPDCLDQKHLLRTDMAPRAPTPRANPLAKGGGPW